MQRVMRLLTTSITACKTVHGPAEGTLEEVGAAVVEAAGVEGLDLEVAGVEGGSLVGWMISASPSAKAAVKSWCSPLCHGLGFTGVG